MWCDDFDGDLYALVPQARDALAEMGHTVLWTHGSVWTDGRLNHPACWNTGLGLAAWFGLVEHGFKPAGFWTNEPLVECTFEEACRSGWVQGWALILRERPLVHFGRDDFRQAFDALLWHARGIRRIDETAVAGYQWGVVEMLKVCSTLLERTIYYYGVKHEQPGD